MSKVDKLDDAVHHCVTQGDKGNDHPIGKTD